jgi:hypothetical protein
MRNILLIEPNYKNKYPPIGLMKIATYHRKLGDNVTFFKGELKEFINDLLTKKRIETQGYVDKKTLFDRVYVATLFTFYWKITIATINLAKTIVKNDSDVIVGGVSATLLYDDVVEQTGIKPIKGLLNKPGMLDKDNDIIVDTLPLDYSILDEIDYKYPEYDAYYGYMTRGCFRNCPFCAVTTLEPKYCEYVSLKDKIEETKANYGDKKNLLLLDNNVLYSARFPEIIQEIIDCGFGKNATYTEPNEYQITLTNLEKGTNDTAYIKKLFNLNLQLLNRIGDNTDHDLHNLLESNLLLSMHTTTKDNLLKVAQDILPLYTRHFRRLPKRRYIDFNQGVDARLFTEEKANLLGKINIRPLRIAFDNYNDRKYYENAIRLSANAGIENYSNYILYNFKDKPIEFYQRLKLNIELCEELDINIYSFPMKFHPITGKDRFNRNYLGKHWNRKYIRAIQAVLNALKGKVGRGVEFFEKAFGATTEQFFKILEMPEAMILYRFFFEWLDDKKKYPVSQNAWWQCWQETLKVLNEQETVELLEIVHQNKFRTLPSENDNPKFSELLKFYVNYRDDINNPKTELYKLKKEYDASPTRKLRRKKKDDS